MIHPVSQISNTLCVSIQVSNTECVIIQIPNTMCVRSQVSNTECVRIQVELSQQQQMVQSKDCNIQEERARQKIYRKGIKGGLDKRNQFPWHEPLKNGWQCTITQVAVYCICILTQNYIFFIFTPM